MANSQKLGEPVRPIAPPRPDNEGNLCGITSLSPKACTTRAGVPVPASKVIPIIVIPGIMGSNLCATNDKRKAPNRLLRPGEAAWRPPNGTNAGLVEAKAWKSRSQADRQRILDGASLDVDDDGPIEIPPDLKADIRQLREDGWGEIHWSSYGGLLVFLQRNLNWSLVADWTRRELTPWDRLNGYDRTRWNAQGSSAVRPLSDAEIKKVANYHYPVYACGYNWLESNEKSAARLRDRIRKIVKYWQDAKQECKQVILVTHSMGGLVSRACAKQIPELIAGIVHGVMPALGAPVCYRRIACGTEASSPSNGKIANIAMEKFAEIAGRNSQETTPVMGTAPGPLELLPNHLYPQPWLYARLTNTRGVQEDIPLVQPENAYEFYRDFDCWYRMINLATADPANLFEGNASRYIKSAINQAERFHKLVLGTYYHPNSYAFYGDDERHLSFANCRWVFKGEQLGLSAETVRSARLISDSTAGNRAIQTAGKSDMLLVEHSIQDGPGDGTVPRDSGAGPVDKVLATFRTNGYDHQGSYADEAMLMLTLQLVARIVQGAK
jgi:pimeloyl-ACP methyl ester carboxylesterase